MIDWCAGVLDAGSAGTHESSMAKVAVSEALFRVADRCVLDWELSTLGDPLADFAYHLMMYRMPPGTVAGLLGADLRALNIPTEAEYVAAYCRRTGRGEIAELDFYVCFTMFRLAAIFHGIKGRAARGTASSARARDYAAGVGWLAELAWRQTQRTTARK